MQDEQNSCIYLIYLKLIVLQLQLIHDHKSCKKKKKNKKKNEPNVLNCT